MQCQVYLSLDSLDWTFQLRRKTRLDLWELGKGGRQEVVERVDEKVDFLAGG